MHVPKDHMAFFRKTSMVTLVAVYLLILVGGIVRSTGAGMGCPDWPKCFGKWIPPTTEDELTDTYKQDFVDYREKKNQKFAGYLDFLGFNKKADQIRNDTSLLQETEFNAVKTWTEYINRLIGAIIGLLIIINFVASISLFRSHTKIFALSLTLVALVLIQGWIGSVVVSTNLLPWMVTVHMLLALLIVAILIYLVYSSRAWDLETLVTPGKGLLTGILVITAGIVLVQILLGTQVRESIDGIATSLNYMARETWISLSGMSFVIHRSFTWIVLVGQFLVMYVIIRNKLHQTRLSNFAWIILGLMILEAGLGMVMAYFNIPPFVQPIHLLFAVGIFGLQLLMIFIVNHRKTYASIEI